MDSERWTKRALREAAPRFDLILLGHIHKYGRVEEVFDIAPTYYLGSTEHTSFNEWQNENGVLVINDGDFSHPSYLDIETAPMKQVRLKLDRMTPEEINDFAKKFETVFTSVLPALISIYSYSVWKGRFCSCRRRNNDCEIKHHI